jgi:hypothetical protein
MPDTVSPRPTTLLLQPVGLMTSLEGFPYLEPNLLTLTSLRGRGGVDASKTKR